MIPNTALRVVESSGVSAQGQFSISEDDSAHIMTILRDTLYSDKILAVLREYSANAWDSHKENGNQSKAIKIHMPTEMEPTLSIRDYGPGLSQEAVMQVYTKYGRSTKRGSDAMVGMLGIGSKSGFAYSDSFTVVSYNGGVKSTWVAVLDASEKGVINRLHEEPCGDETGVEIQIPVKPSDIPEFNNKAKELFRYFEPRPSINIELPPAPIPKMKLQNGVIYEFNDHNYHPHRDDWVAVMGCVPYRINIGQFVGAIPEFIRGLSGAVYFKIGEVQINASREELKYSDETKKVLVDRFAALVDEYVVRALDEIEKGGFTPWEKRLKAMVLKHMGLPVPKGVEELMQDRVSIKGFVTDKMTIWKMTKEIAATISIDAHTRFVIKDDMRPLLGFQLQSNDLLVKPAPKVKLDEVLADLNKLIDGLGLTGIPVQHLSKMGWTNPTKAANGRTINPKHHKDVFVYDSEKSRGDGSSSRWEPVQREPSKDDVFVILHRFKTGGSWSFNDYYRADKLMSKVFGTGEMPPVYGYKTTDKKPVKPEDCLGTEYRAWRDRWVAALLTPENKEMLEQWRWSRLFVREYGYRDDDKDQTKRKRLVKNLGENHHIVSLFDKYKAGKKAMQAAHEKARNISDFYERVKNLVPGLQADKEFQATLDTYPLLKVIESNFEPLWGGDNAELWAQYIKLVDTNGGNNNGISNPVHDEQ